MSDTGSDVLMTEQAGALVAEFGQSKLLDEVVIADIGRRLLEAVESRQKPLVVLDFANVEHMSSAALGMLISIHKHVRERHGQLRLCSIHPNIFKVFEITKLNEVFQILDNRAAALGSLA